MRGTADLWVPISYCAFRHTKALYNDEIAMPGRCKALDAAADGYVRSEAVGCIILSPLKHACNHQQTASPAVLVLRGSAVNQDGRSSSLTAPNGPAQHAVMRRALAVGTAMAAEVALLHSAALKALNCF